MDASYEAIERADDSGQVSYTRHLCEARLRDHPDHGPTLLRYADNLTALNLFDEAHAALDHAEKVAPEKWLRLVFAGRGHLLKKEGRFAEAEEGFMQAHQLSPGDATYLIYAGGAAAGRGDLEGALDLYTRATLCAEGCIDEAHYNRGGTLLALKRYAEAAEAYREALRIDPDYRIAKERLEDVEMILAEIGGDGSSAPV